MFRRKLMKVIVAILIIAGSPAMVGCALKPAPTEYFVKPIFAPERPLLPRLTEADVQCLSKEAFFKLVNRDRIRREYAEELEVIIQTTQNATQSEE